MGPHVLSHVRGISANGRILVGDADDGGLSNNRRAAVWESGNLRWLDLLPGGTTGYAMGVSEDGAVIVGEADDGMASRAVYWDDAGVHALANLSNGTGYYSRAYAVNADHRIIVGQTDNAAGLYVATKWQDGTPVSLGLLRASDLSSVAYDVDASGSIVVGSSFSGMSFINQAVYWDGGNIIHELNPLSFTNRDSIARAISSNGRIFVGMSRDDGNIAQAVRWDYDGVNAVITQLAVLPASAGAQALAVNGDGTVIVGSALDQSMAAQAVKWTPQGAETLVSVLTKKGVSLSGLSLAEATGVSEDGIYITGNGINRATGNGFAFIANTGGADRVAGVTSVFDLAKSLNDTGSSTAAQAGSLNAMQFGQGMFQAHSMIPASTNAGSTSLLNADALSSLEPAAGGISGWELYSAGSMGLGQGHDIGDRGFNGMIGVRKRLASSFGIGIGLNRANARTDMAFGGTSGVKAKGTSLIAAYEPVWSRLRLYGFAFGTALDFDIRRGYANGTGLDSSTARATGLSYGASLQAGYDFALTERWHVIPYAEYRRSQTQIDAYAETGGAFPALFGARLIDQASMRLGIRNDYALRPDMNLTGRLAMVNALQNEGIGFSATSAGLTVATGFDPGDSSWVEGGIGMEWRVSPAAAFSFEAGTRTGNTNEPQINLVMGAEFRF